MERHDTGENASEGENAYRQQSLRKGLTENLWIRVAIKTNEATDFGLVTEIDEIMGATKKLIEVDGKLTARPIFPRSRKIRSCLALQ